MKTLTIAAALFFITNMLAAQLKSNQITGSIIDSLSKQPLPNATVILTNNKGAATSKTITSDTKGNFIFKNVANGNYTLTINYIGYKTIVIDKIIVDINNEPNKPIITKLILEQKGLKAVTVNATKPFIVMSIDKITLNVANSPIAAGGNAYDILMRAPGVVEQNNSLTLNGKGVNVLINGRPSNLTGEELKTMLTNMQANGIEKVEVISSPSAKYDAQGAGIINIILAKNKNFGTNGTFVAGIGTGRFVKTNSGITLNYRNKKSNIYGGYDYAYYPSYVQNSSNRNLTSNSAILENEYEVRKRNNHGYKIGFDYDINKHSSFGILARSASNFRDRNVNHGTSLSVVGMTKDTTSNISTNGSSNVFNPSVNVYYKITLDSAGKQDIVVNADYFYYNRKSNDNLITKYLDGNGFEYQMPFYLRDNSPGIIEVKSVTADYTGTLKFVKWEAGAKASFAKTDNNVLWEQQVNGIWKTDATKTNHFIYKENIYAGYINFNKTINKFGLLLGFRGEQTNTNGTSITINQTNTNSYFNLFPNVAFSYKKSANHQFKIGYRKSIQRFGYEVVNPFVVYQSQYSFTQGNPAIKPMFLHTIEFSYSYKYELFTTLSYTHYTQTLAQVYKPDPSTNAVISTYENLNNSQVVSATITSQKSFYKGKWSSVNTLGAYYSHYDELSFGESVKSIVTSYINSQNTLILLKKIRAEITAYYSTPIASGIYKIDGQFQMNIGFSKPILKSKATLAINIKDIFNTFQYNIKTLYKGVNIYTEYKAESRFANLVFTYKFGNIKVKASKKRETGIEDEKERINSN